MKFLKDLVAVLPHLDTANTVRFCKTLEKYRPHLSEISENLYEKLPLEDRQRFIIWFLKRWAKIDLINKVELNLYNQKLKSIRYQQCEDVALNGTSYKLRDFSLLQEHDFKLLCYGWVSGVHDIYYNQYEHRDVRLMPGDVIIDAGAFIGDTAVLFNYKLKGDCEVHCFELLDENLALLVKNLEINRVDMNRIHINKLALTDKSEDEIRIKTGKTQGSTSIYGSGTQTDTVQTITLDDYVSMTQLQRVDFIKMDIEGAEIPALQGAIQTIRHFKPRLALCLYHKDDDVMTIPKFLKELGVPYRFNFKWVQLTDGWEAVLLATPIREEDAATTTTESVNESDHLLKVTFFSLTEKLLAAHCQ